MRWEVRGAMPVQFLVHGRGAGTVWMSSVSPAVLHATPGTMPPRALVFCVRTEKC